MPQHESPGSPGGNTLTIEAPTVEAALTQVTDELGPSAQIIDARKVQRGGIKGFFTKEMVQLTARRPGPFRSPSDEEAAERRARLPVDRGLVALLASSEAQPDEPDFVTVPKRELGNNTTEPQHQAVTGDTDTANESAPLAGPPVAPEDELPASRQVGPMTVAPSPFTPPQPDPADAGWRLQHPDPHDAPGTGPVGWSTTALARLGLPEVVMAAVGGIDPADDLGWINGIAAAAEPFCGPLSRTSALIAGPNADRIGETIGIPAIFPPTMPPHAGSVTAVVTSDPKGTAWLDDVIGDRDLHLVIGEEDWRGALIKDPTTVSWVGDTGVVDALYLCATLGATLGYGTVDGPMSAPIRVRPIDVALAVRRIVGRT